MNIELNTFASACYDDNSIDELEQALIDGPDATDMTNWNLSESEWWGQVEHALAELRAGSERCDWDCPNNSGS